MSLTIYYCYKPRYQGREEGGVVVSTCCLSDSCVCLGCNIAEHMRAVYQIASCKAVHLDT